MISVGATNTYGHPAPEALAAYKRLKSTVFRTDLDGAVKRRPTAPTCAFYRDQDLTPRPVAWNHQMLAAERAQPPHRVSPLHAVGEA